MTTAEIMNILHRLDPGAVAAAGAAHTSLGDVLAAMAASLTRHAQTLAQNWTGTAARTAMTRFQQLHDQTSVLATQAAQTGSVLTWLGTQVLPKFQQLQTPGTGFAVAADAAAGGIAGEVVAGPAGAMAGTAVGGLGALLTGAGDAAAQAQAQKYLSALSSYLVTANAALPDQIGGVAHRPAAGAAGAQAANGTAGGGTFGGGGTGTGTRGAAGAAGTGGAGVAGPVTGRRGAGSSSLARMAGTGAVLGAGAGATGSARGAGGTGSGPAAGGSGSTSTAADTGTVPGADATGLPGGVAGAVPSTAGTPARAVSSLQSAAPVPGGAPGAAPSPATPASGTSGAGDLGASAASPLSPVPMVPGLSGSGAAGGAGGGRGGGTAARDGEDPPAAGLLPGIHGAVGDGALPEVAALGNGTAGASPLPELPTLGDGLIGGASPLPGVAGLDGAVAGASPLPEAPGLDGPTVDVSPLPGAPGLDGGLTGGATPLPDLPVTAPAMGAVPAGEAAGSSAVAADVLMTPGSGDSPWRSGLGGMPMAGGGSGQPDQERARHVWEYEDENVWGLPPGCVPPVIEGG